MEHHPPPSHIGMSNHVHDQFHLVEPGSCMSFYAISCSNHHAINNNIEAGADHIVDDSGVDIIDHHHHSPPPVLDSSEGSPHSFSDHHHDFIALLHGSDPVKEEINRLENEVREKNREMAETQAEIKALKLAERSREKALEELSDELARVDDRLERAELLLDNKNLELKRLSDEKRAAQAAQHAAEATLRRVQAAQKDEDMPPIEAILAPLDAEIKLTRQEVARLQEDNRALDRLTKAKEAALLEAEGRVQIATAKASMVDDLQNKNQELARHIDFCQEENKLLDKLHRQKITEVEKLSMTVEELEEELLLSSGNTANAARDYQRQLQQVQEEKKSLERELARVKITANRVAVVVANGWKDSNDKVMPVRQWLEERRFLQGEMVQLREKLASMEKTAKTEAILKEKVQLRLKVLEENFLNAPPGNAFHGAAAPSRPPPARAHLLSLNIAGGSSYKSVNFSNTTNTATLAAGRSINSAVNRYQDGRKLLGRCNSARALLQRNVRSISKSFNAGNTVEISSKSGLLNQQQQQIMSKISPAPDNRDTNCMVNTSSSCVKVESAAICTGANVQVLAPSKPLADVTGDYVSGQLYDLLQKEVILLRKTCYEKDRGLSDKDNAIEMLEKKVGALNRAMELESKRMRREVATMEKEVAALRSSCAANHNNNNTITNQDSSCGNNNVESSSSSKGMNSASNKNANGALRFR